MTKLIYRLNLYLLKRFDSVIAVSSEIQQRLVNFGFAPSRITLLPNIPGVYSFSQKELDEPSNAFSQFDKIIGFVGRLEGVKGCGRGSRGW